MRGNGRIPDDGGRENPAAVTAVRRNDFGRCRRVAEMGITAPHSVQILTVQDATLLFLAVGSFRLKSENSYLIFP